MKTTKFIKTKLIVLTIIFTPLLTSCLPLVIGSTLATTATLTKERRPLGKILDDISTEQNLQTLVKGNENLKGTHVSVTSLNGIVLLTGEVLDDQQRQLAEKLVKENSETREVVNELELSGNANFTSRSNDNYIATKVKSKLFQEFSLGVNVKVVVERGKVYLMGILTKEEAEQAIMVVQSVKGVTQIVKVFEYKEKQ